MSQENVELVVRLIPPPGADLAQLVRDDGTWAQLVEAIGPFFDPRFECVGHLLGQDTVYGRGLDGFRAFWLDWLTPWASYRMDAIEQAVDCGDHVVVVVRDSGRRADTTQELKGRNAGVWTVRDGRATRWQGYPAPTEAFKAVGLEE